MMETLAMIVQSAKDTFFYEVKEEELRKNSEVDWNFIYVPMILAVFLMGLRHVVENHIFRPLGILHGLKPVHKPKNVPHNSLLEQVYGSHRKRFPLATKVKQMAKELGWTERQVQRWFRLRMAKDKTPKLVKFMESGWKFTFYLITTLFLIIAAVRLECDWMFNIPEHHRNFPYTAKTPSVWIIYVFEQAFYVASLFTIFTDVRRKDFVEMGIHHTLSVVVPALCWYYNAIRYGVIVYLTHDCCDVFLELAKMLNYIKWKRSTDACFILFTIVWFVNRLYIFPFHILRNGFFHSFGFMYTRPYYIINSAGIILFMLHLVWTYYIIKVLLRVISSGKGKDSRSSSSDNEISADEENGAIDKKKS